MRNTTKFFIALATVWALSLTVAPQASAGLHLEPFIGMALSGETEQTGSTSEDYTGGPLLGARIGYGMLGFFIAGEYEMGTLTADGDPETDVDQTSMGVSLGYEFPILVRVYGTYMFDAKGEVESGEFSGTGMKLGVGYTGLPFVSINLEMTQSEFDEFDGASLTNPLKVSYYTLGVSLPLNF